eukprot:6477533-Amphidinium_carterae.1
MCGTSTLKQRYETCHFQTERMHGQGIGSSWLHSNQIEWSVGRHRTDAKVTLRMPFPTQCHHTELRACH